MLTPLAMWLAGIFCGVCWMCAMNPPDWLLDRLLSDRGPLRRLAPKRWAALRIARLEVLFALRPVVTWRDLVCGPVPVVTNLCGL